jgi:hypothetical protein
MLPTLKARTGLAVIVATLYAGGASALPAPVKETHPRLYATQSDFDRVRQAAAVGPASFPATKGRLAFTITPVPKGALDPGNTPIFDSVTGSGQRIVVRYSDATSDPVQTGTRIQVGLISAKETWQWVRTFDVTPNEPTRFEMAYDGNGALTVKLGGKTETGTLAGTGWKASAQRFEFMGHKGDRIADLQLDDETGTRIVDIPVVDLDLHLAWRGFRDNTIPHTTKLNACDTSLPIASQSSACLYYLTGGRAVIFEHARRQALAYRFTGEERFLGAARKHIEMMLQVGKTSGGEWDMSSRVAAMGLYYDWLNAQLDTPYQGSTYLKKLEEGIKGTIMADGPGSDDLIYSVCGYHQTVTDGAAFDCAVKPNYTTTANYVPSIADTYISGHPASANALVAAGLLAIAHERPEVVPMLDTVYEHFRQGFLRARDIYGADGGSHTLFAYGGSGAVDTPDRLVMWQRALDLPAGVPALTLAAQPKLVYPYIYGLRHDGTFPARGDAFAFPAAATNTIALAAVAEGDGYAENFYRNHVIGERDKTPYPGRLDMRMVWERLLFPATATPAPFRDLPLARHFRMAGNVLIRDTWDFANATLLEFKSTSFTSINHQHLDQNTFSLNYKGPLLLDSGQYDEYGTVHWRNYYQRTIAHNGIVLFDPAEQFVLPNGEVWNNDGGQSYDGRVTSPLISDIEPGGANALDGVTAFEDGGAYAYVAGNASKAYAKAKVDQQAGALRSIVYLRRGDGRNAPTPPTILVFDSVRAKKPIAATSLLHMAEKPVATQPHLAGTGGRYEYGFAASKSPFTIRNQKGMVTVQALLPADGTVTLVGGLNHEGNTCVPVVATNPDRKTGQKDGAPTGDCRFLVREIRAGGPVWRNYPPRDAENFSGDVGAWRLEISPRSAPAAGTPQYFLNVLHVADNDGLSGVAPIDPASVLPGDANTVAVQLGDGEVVVFNGGPAPAGALAWTRPSAKGTTLVVGLKRNTRYALAVGTTVALTENANGTLQSSDNGVLQLDL